MKIYSILFIIVFLLFSCNNNLNNVVEDNLNNVVEDNLNNVVEDNGLKIVENDEISIEQLDLIFMNEKAKDYIDIGDYQSEISKGTKEASFLLSFIKYEEINNINGFILKKIIGQSDKSDIKYYFYTKGDKLYGARKVVDYYEPAKSTGNPLKIDEINQTCYNSLNDCSEDILFLFDFIETVIEK